MNQQKQKDNANELWSGDQGIGRLWQMIVDEVTKQAADEPELVTYFHDAVLSHNSLEAALAYNLALKLDSNILSAMTIRQVFTEALTTDLEITDKMCRDLAAYVERDPACDQYSLPLLYFKGFHALQIYRIAHWLWSNDRKSLALYLQNRVSEIFAVDIHPAESGNIKGFDEPFTLLEARDRIAIPNVVEFIDNDRRRGHGIVCEGPLGLR